MYSPGNPLKDYIGFGGLEQCPVSMSLMTNLAFQSHLLVNVQRTLVEFNSFGDIPIVP
jgi:hypothetical protein